MWINKSDLSCQVCYIMFSKKKSDFKKRRYDEIKINGTGG